MTDHTGQPADDPDLARELRRTDWLVNVYCLAAVGNSLAGQIEGAIDTLGLPVAAAVALVCTLEVGAIAIFHAYDVRRRLGEPALSLLGLALAVGGVATWVNAATHHGIAAVAYPAMTVLAIALYVVRAEFKRRDRARARGHGRPLIPTYELVGHWLRHPWLTRRAQSIAKRTVEAGGTIGRYESIDAARAERADARADALLTAKLRDRFGADGSLAAAVYDARSIAARMRAEAPNSAVADSLMAQLAADSIAALAVRKPTRRAARNSPARDSAPGESSRLAADSVPDSPRADSTDSATRPAAQASAISTPPRRRTGSSTRGSSQVTTQLRSDESIADSLYEAFAERADSTGELPTGHWVHTNGGGWPRQAGRVRELLRQRYESRNSMPNPVADSGRESDESDDPDRDRGEATA